MDLVISKMSTNDLAEIKNDLKCEFDSFWNHNIFVQELSNNNSYYITAKLYDKVIGFAGFMIIVDEAHITNIAVKKYYRNKKIGTKLLDELLSIIKSNDNIKSVTLEVKEFNSNAIKLYEKFGFEQVGFRKKYYKDDSNAIIMTKNL